jgi:hypothetical protein
LARGILPARKLLARFCCALNDISYTGPLSVEWEDPRMGAKKTRSFVRTIHFPASFES